jgi:hypothetical protein
LLIPLVCSADEDIKWRAVAFGGLLLARLADEDIEHARIFIRRQIWNLTEESGGCPLGAPELMAEAMARHRGLADEYANILVSYIIPESNYLEHIPLQRGAGWGIGRLAEVYPELVRDSVPYLKELKKSEDDSVRELACLALSKLDFGSK